MSRLVLIKPFTDKYSQVDREMIYLSTYNVYKNKDVPIELNQLGVSEAAYISYLDLPIVDIKDNTIEEFDDMLLRDNIKNVIITDVLLAINDSIQKFYILKRGEDFYFSRFLKNSDYWRHKIHTHIPIHNFVKYYREKKLEELFEEN